MVMPQLIDRVSVDDLMSLATDRGSVPLQVGAVLLLDTSAGLDPRRALETLAHRIESVPRLRQRLVRPQAGHGRPFWVDDPKYSAANHLFSEPCPAPGGEPAILDVAARIIGTRLPIDQPLWSATLVTEARARTGTDVDTAAGSGSGDASSVTALIIVFHHVLADGIGGLAVLANLVDRPDPTASRARGAASDGGAARPVFPRPAPSSAALVADARAERIRSLRRLPTELRRLAGAATVLRSGLHVRVKPSSLNRQTGTRRRFASMRLDLAHVHAAARAHDATVNDVVLTAIAGALNGLLVSRDGVLERRPSGAHGPDTPATVTRTPGTIVISVPVSARTLTDATDLGNQSGAIPLALPGSGDPFVRLALVASITREIKTSPLGASTALLGPFFRLLARLGLFQWFIDRQRLIHTFATNLRGPQTPITLFGSPVTDLVPLTVPTGNVTISFAVLSYAGTLRVTINVDPDACPDLPVLLNALEAELHALAPMRL